MSSSPESTQGCGGPETPVLTFLVIEPSLQQVARATKSCECPTKAEPGTVASDIRLIRVFVVIQIIIHIVGIVI